MKFLVSILFFTTFAMADNLTNEEQKKLLEENQMLRQEIKKLQSAPPEDSHKMMEALKKGQKFQEDQNKALEELDKED